MASAKKVHTKELEEVEENLKAAVQRSEELRVRLTNVDLKAIHFV